MGDFILFPGPFIYVYKLEEHSRIKEIVIPYIEKDIKKVPVVNCENEYTQSSYYYNREQFYDFLIEKNIIDDIVWKPLDKCIENFPFKIKNRITRSNISQIWYNAYDTGGHHKHHTHANSTFSAIYLCHLEEPNKTVFFGQGSGNSSYQSFNYHTDDITEGHILIFPSEMYHLVKPVETKRIVIAFNITSY